MLLKLPFLAGEKGSMTGVDALLTASPRRPSADSPGRQVHWYVPREKLTILVTEKLNSSFSGGSPYYAPGDGSGCVLGTLMAVLSAGAGNDPAAGASCAIVLLRLAAEIADRKASGPGSFRSELLDALFRVSPEDLLEEQNRMTVKE